MLNKVAKTCCLLLLLFSAVATAVEYSNDDYTFTSPATAQQFNALLPQLRCLVCQNQSLADSDAPLAQDLRNVIYSKMQQGETKEEIINFLISRYGDFVLYNPQLKATTYGLWFGPLLILAVALLLLSLLLKKHAAQVKT